MNAGADRLRVASVTGMDVELPIAGLGGRSYAFVIDWHIRIAGALAWFGLSSLILYGDLLAAVDEVNALLFFAVVAPSLVIYLLYHPILEIAMHGRTPGKRIAGVRIVAADGHVPSVGALLIRNLLRTLDSLPTLYAVGLATTLVTRQALRIGDIAAGTVLVYDDADARPARNSIWRTSGLANVEADAVARLGLERVELVCELLSRWDVLDAGTRRQLAARLLEEDADAATEAEFKGRLQELVR